MRMRRKKTVTCTHEGIVTPKLRVFKGDEGKNRLKSAWEFVFLETSFGATDYVIHL